MLRRGRRRRSWRCRRWVWRVRAWRLWRIRRSRSGGTRRTRTRRGRWRIRRWRRVRIGVWFCPVPATTSFVLLVALFLTPVTTFSLWRMSAMASARTVSVLSPISSPPSSRWRRWMVMIPTSVMHMITAIASMTPVTATIASMVIRASFRRRIPFYAYYIYCVYEI